MKQKTFETILYSTAGVAAMFVVMVSCYIIISAFKVRVDVTADKDNTLSAGTKDIIGKVRSHVTIRFYCTQGDNAMPPDLRTYAQHIEDLLGEYKQIGQGKIIVQKLDPKPDSDAEDSARLNGIEGQAIGPMGANKIYLGIVVSIFDQKFALPWLPPDRERFLEYDISRAISRVESGTPPTVGIMSTYPVFGMGINPMSLHRDDHSNDPWAFVSELKKDFNVVRVPMDANRIDNSIKVLVVVHPRNISDETQYALDQFVLHGGKLLAFLDPHAFFDESNSQNDRRFQVVGANAYGQSSLPLLLKAWGLEMNVDKVVADMSLGSRNPRTGEMNATILLANRAHMDDNDVISSQMDNLALPFAGAFTGKPPEGIHETSLVYCSTNSQLVDSLIATASAEAIVRDFKSDNIAYPLAVHLTGKFKTAFPKGAPEGADSSQLKESSGAGEVVLVGDTDMLNDRACVRIQNAGGHRVSHPMNGNLNFVQGVVEYFSGDDDLISSRGRASSSRPFTRLKDMQAQAGKQWEEKIRVLESKQHEMERVINELETHKGSGGQEQMILTPDQEAELESYQATRVQVAKDLKEVRKNLGKDTEALEFWTKIINISAMPAIVAISGLALAVVKHNRNRSARK
jgi:ABC-type uncharacterized transport system involved in gliding motility auxiliary subunit